MIRPADEADIDRLVGMGEKFHEAKQTLYPFCSGSTRDFFSMSIARGIVLISEGGFLSGQMVPAPSNRTYFSAYETFWWAEDRSGFRLLRAFEKWAAERGCSEVVISFPAQEGRLERCLVKAGYTVEGNSMRRAVECA